MHNYQFASFCIAKLYLTERTWRSTPCTIKKNNTSFLWVCWVAHKFDFDKLQVAEGEARTSLLQREVERLSQALFKAQENESLLREKAMSLKKSIQEAAASHNNTQSRVTALQKVLSEAEQDKRLLQVSKTEGKQGCEHSYHNIMLSLCL